MRGHIKGTDSSINSILQTVGIYRTGGEFIEPEAVEAYTYALPSLLTAVNERHLVSAHARKRRVEIT